MPSYCGDEYTTWRLIQFEGEDYYNLYDMYDGHLVCPYEFIDSAGRQGDMPIFRLKNDNGYYTVDENGNLRNCNI